MATFGTKSLERLQQIDPELQKLLVEAIQHYDFFIICGHRGQEAQDNAYNTGRSKLKFPKSKHNQYPSLAVDIAPYPVDWNNLNEFKELSKVVKEAAKKLDIDITWGGDWTSLVDMPHYELKKKS